MAGRAAERDAGPFMSGHTLHLDVACCSAPLFAALQLDACNFK
jgi:hypothetical protein